MDERERHANGMEVRRAVLGNTHVDKAQANSNEFNADMDSRLRGNDEGRHERRNLHKGPPAKNGIREPSLSISQALAR